MQARRGTRGIVLVILNLNATLRPLHLRQKSPGTRCKRAGWAQGTGVEKRKPLNPTAIPTPNRQSRGVCYTDYAILAPVIRQVKTH
jgi:hypothetical protein